MRKNILVTGATGKQGSALIRALLDASQSSPSFEYHISAPIRNVASPSAQQLVQAYGSSNITLIEGNFDNKDSVISIFETAERNSNGIRGVFAVLGFPELGASADGEERQGKMWADVALDYKVKVFVYSSAMRAGPNHEENLEFKPSKKARRNIEKHCRALGERGLRWM